MKALLRNYKPLALALGLSLLAMAAGAQNDPAIVRRVAAGHDLHKGLNIQIVTSRPVVPTIIRLANPIRIVIDLPNSVLGGPPQRILVNQSNVTVVRTGQFQKTVARVVVEMSAPRDYSLIASGINLTFWLLPGAAAETKPAPSAPRREPEVVPQSLPMPITQGDTVQVKVGKIETLRGPTNIAADTTIASLKLPRGGEVRVCPGTSLSATPSQNGRDLMLGISTGAIETHYDLGPASDVIMTPDFRILLPGPGRFNLAVSADRSGTTCVRALEGNSSSVIVSEMMGDANYQVNPNEQVAFRGGHLRNVSYAIPTSCGCPTSTVPVMRAENTPPAEPAPPAGWTPSAAPAVTNQPPVPAEGPHIQVEAPFVYRASQAPAPVPVPGSPDVAQLALADTPPEIASITVSRPTQVTHYRLKQGKVRKTAPNGFFGKIRGFFGAMFH